MKVKVLSIFIILLLFKTNLLVADDLSSSVVTIRVTTQDYDYYSPWQKESVNTYTLYGCVLADDLILTLSHPLYRHVYVEVSKNGQQQRFPAQVLIEDYYNGLALLTVHPESFFDDLKPVTFLGQENFPGKAAVVKWDNQGIFKQYNAEIYKTAIQLYERLGVALFHLMTTSLDSGGNGEPVFQDGKLLGITSWFDKDEKTIKVNSSENIKHMLADFHSPPYKGGCLFYLNEKNLMSDNNLKEYLGMSSGDTGLYIINVPPASSGYNELQKGDVVLSIDGENIDDSGVYNSTKYGKLNYLSIIGLNHYVGDTLELEVMRNKKRVTIFLELLPILERSFLIPTLYTTDRPEYFICGGLLFQELFMGYLNKVWSNDWTTNADKRFIAYALDKWLAPSKERNRIVILNRVLPASVNQGYQDKSNLVLLKINDQPVQNLLHTKQIIDNSTDDFIIFEFEGKEFIVLEKSKIIQGEEEILKLYGITEPFFLN